MSFLFSRRRARAARSQRNKPHDRATCPDCLARADVGGSPIEQSFWKAYQRINPPELRGLVREHPVHGYRIDFALTRRKFGIELDGRATHSSTAAIAADRKRQRTLEAAGWRIIRFGGSEVHRDAAACVREAAKLAGRLR